MSHAMEPFSHHKVNCSTCASIDTSSTNFSGHRHRLRERFHKVGISGFADHEIIELLLTLVLPRRDVKPIAKQLIQQFGSVSAVIHAPEAELHAVIGGKMVPFLFKFIKELCIFLLHPTQDRPAGDCLDNFCKLERFWSVRLKHMQHEVFEVAYLDSQLQIIDDGIVQLEQGIVNKTHIYIRKIFERALEKHAYALILAHNHPLGPAHPSDNDILITEKVMLLAKHMDMVLIDHIIVANGDIFSFRKAGYIKNMSK